MSRRHRTVRFTRVVAFTVVVLSLVVLGVAGDTEGTTRQDARGFLPFVGRGVLPGQTPSPLATATQIPTLAATQTSTSLPAATASPTPPGLAEHVDEEAGIRFLYPSRFTLNAPATETRLAALSHGQAAILVFRFPHNGTTVEQYTDSLINYWCTQFPPCEVLEREATTLGGEPGERMAIRWLQDGQEWVRLTVSANRGIYRFEVYLVVPSSEYPEYRGDAETVMTSFEFLNSAP